MLDYLLKSGLCLLVLYVFYKLLLEAESMHEIKRFYLIGGVLFSLVIPLITISYTVHIQPENFSENLPLIERHSPTLPSDGTSLFDYFLVIYILGFLFFSYRFTRNLFKIGKEIRSNEKRKRWKYIFVLLKNSPIPHTFLNYIFLNKFEFEQARISKAIIDHEKAHVDQKHSLDILFIEFLQVVFWFNPLFYFWKRSIRLNHEFLADRQVLAANPDMLEYTNLILNYNYPNHQKAFASHINSSLIKKRIIMITREFSIKRILLKLGLLLPILALCVYLFNNEIVAKPIFKASEISIENYQFAEQDPNKLNIKMEGDKVFLNGKNLKLKDLTEELDKFAKDRSDEELKEMDFNIQVSNINQGFIKDVDREFQKSRIAKATGFSLIPPPPPAPIKAVPATPAPSSPETLKVEPPAPPAVPEPKVHDKTPPAPTAPPHPVNNSIKRLARREMVQERVHERMDRKRAKMEQLRTEKMEMRREKIDSLRLKRDAIHQEKMNERMAVMEMRHAEVKEKQLERRAHMKAEKDRLREERKRLIELEKKNAEKENNGSD